MILRYALVLIFIFLFATPVTAQKISYNKKQKLVTLENQITAIENKAFELKETIKDINNKIFKKNFSTTKSLPKITIVHISRFGGLFRVRDLTFSLNEKKIFHKTSSGSQSIKSPQNVYVASVKPGTYVLKVVAKIQGYGFGILQHAKKYKATLFQNFSVRLYYDRKTTVKVFFIDNGAKSFGKRLLIKFKKSEQAI